MSSQRPIKDEMWSDDWFYDLDPSEKLMWVFLLTNPRQNVAGVFNASESWFCSHTGFDKQVVRLILERFVLVDKIRRLGNWIIITNHYKHQSLSPKIEEGIARILRDLPKTILEIYPIDRVCIRYRTLLNLTLPNSEANALAEKDMSWNKQSEDYEEGVIDLDGDSSLIVEEKKKAPRKYPNAPAIRKIFQEVLGRNPANWKMNKTQLQACENLYTERTPEKVRSALEFYKEEEGKKYCPIINSPYDLDTKWTNLGDFKLRL